MRNYMNLAGLIGILLILAGLILYSINETLNLFSTLLLILGSASLIAFVVFRYQEVKSILGRRSVRFGSNVLLMSIIVLGILILVNFITHQHSWRVDTTAAKQFSLAEQTKKLLKSVKKEIRVTAFFKSDNQGRMKDLLEEYGNYSPYFKYELIDPDQKPSIAKQYGITAYGTTVIQCADKEEKITTVSEEDLTNALIKVTREGVKKIYFTTGHGENDIDGLDREGYNAAKKAIENENYEVDKIILAEKENIPDDCTVLVVSGPQKELLSHEEDMIDAYLKKGGKAMFLIDPSPSASLSNLLSKWGIEVGDNTVIDNSPVGRLFGVGPGMPLVSKYESHEITKKFKIMTIFPLARSVTPAKEPQSGLTVQSLAKTSPFPNSWGETNLVDLKQRRIARYDEGKDLKGPVSVAAVATKDVEGGSSGSTSDSFSGKKVKTRLVVFGDSDFASNSYFHLQGNGDLFMNALSWLAEEEDLISIRPRDPEDRRVNLTQKQSRIIFWLGVVLLPVLVLGTGVGVYVMRR